MSKKFITSVVAGALAIISTILFMSSIIVFGKQSGNYVYLLCFAGLAAAAFAVFSVLNFKFSKVGIMVSIFVLFVSTSILMSIFESLVASLSMSNATSGIMGSEVMQLVLLALFVVATVFALKNKKWATIIMFVIIGLDLLNVFQGMYANIVIGQNLKMESYAVLDGFLFTMLAMCFADVALITYFAANQYITD